MTLSESVYSAKFQSRRVRNVSVSTSIAAFGLLRLALYARRPGTAQGSALRLFNLLHSINSGNNFRCRLRVRFVFGTEHSS
jgi:hypothetical protein